jgi:tRNA pseudouridine38-40 synthase
MVRGIAGTLIKIGRREWPPESVARILAALDRREAGMNVPPEGLFLVQVHYGE